MHVHARMRMHAKKKTKAVDPDDEEGWTLDNHYGCSLVAAAALGR